MTMGANLKAFTSRIYTLQGDRRVFQKKNPRDLLQSNAKKTNVLPFARTDTHKHTHTHTDTTPVFVLSILQLFQATGDR